MMPRGAGDLAAARLLLDNLRALRGHEVPASLAATTLSQLGLADRYVTVETPLGRMFVAYNGTGVSAVGAAPSAAQFERDFAARRGRRAFSDEAVPRWLTAAFDQQVRGPGRPTLRFDLRGISEFERAVLLKALEIPRGEVRPYAWIAREIGHPRSVRAVGTALAHNPIPLLIPCHRVVLSDGHLGRYSLIGDEAKREILAAEGADLPRLEALARQGVRFLGSDTTHVYCFPTCRHGRRVAERHERRFSSQMEASAAGYRPCKVCRPPLEA